MTGRQKAIAFFIVLCVFLVGVAITLNVSWILTHGRRVGLIVFGVIFFAIIIAGIIIYTVFLIREIRRNEQHDSFINAVTHELKTPVASIKLYLETLQSRDLSEEQRQEFYGRMLADTDRLLHTVEQVLRAGIAGQKKRKHQRVPTDLRELLTECADLSRIRHHLNPGALEIESSTWVKDATVIGDPEDLRTAVINLIDNAVKYSGEVVKVRLELLPFGAEKLQVRVIDQGIGIPRQQIKLLFQRFYRVPGRKTKAKGTGLGLFIVRSIAKKHGGRVFAESEGEGKGATFTLELPRAAV